MTGASFSNYPLGGSRITSAHFRDCHFDRSPPKLCAACEAESHAPGVFVLCPDCRRNLDSGEA